MWLCVWIQNQWCAREGRFAQPSERQCVCKLFGRTVCAEVRTAWLCVSVHTLCVWDAERDVCSANSRLSPSQWIKESWIELICVCVWGGRRGEEVHRTGSTADWLSAWRRRQVLVLWSIGIGRGGEKENNRGKKQEEEKKMTAVWKIKRWKKSNQYINKRGCI